MLSIVFVVFLLLGMDYLRFHDLGEFQVFVMVHRFLKSLFMGFLRG